MEVWSQSRALGHKESNKQQNQPQLTVLLLLGVKSLDRYIPPPAAYNSCRWDGYCHTESCVGGMFDTRSGPSCDSRAFWKTWSRSPYLPSILISGSIGEPEGIWRVEERRRAYLEGRRLAKWPAGWKQRNTRRSLVPKAGLLPAFVVALLDQVRTNYRNKEIALTFNLPTVLGSASKVLCCWGLRSQCTAQGCLPERGCSGVESNEMNAPNQSPVLVGCLRLFDPCSYV